MNGYFSEKKEWSGWLYLDGNERLDTENEEEEKISYMVRITKFRSELTKLMDFVK